MEQDTKPKHRYQRSYFGPILLITVGVLFLGNNLGIIPDVGWGLVWRFWPVLLIIGGLDDLIRRQGVAWPILLVGAGAFLLFNNFGSQSWISWTQIFQLWPILLIAVGIDIMFKGQSGWIAAAGVVMAIALIGGAAWFISSGVEVSAEYYEIKETFTDDVSASDIDVSLGLGELIFSDLDTPRVLVAGTITPDEKEEQISVFGDVISYQLENNQPKFYPHTARWELGLTDQLDLDLSVNNGVGEMFLALENLDLVTLNVNQGVGRLIIRMPESSDAEILVKQAIGTILIQIPLDTRVVVDAQNGLSKVSFPPKFELENGYYSSPGATKNNADLLIIVEQAIGLVTFRYAR